jgi:hypothetical protein
VINSDGTDPEDSLRVAENQEAIALLLRDPGGREELAQLFFARHAERLESVAAAASSHDNRLVDKVEIETLTP